MPLLTSLSVFGSHLKATTSSAVNHLYPYDDYWSDDEVLIDGSVLYTGQHNNTTANNVTQFTEGDAYVNTNGSGVVTLSYDVTHSYPYGSYWSDASSLADGITLYTGEHTNSTANIVTQFTEGDYYVNTNGSGVVTLTYVINHLYPYDDYWSDASSLANGSVLYVGEHTNSTANIVTQFTEGAYYVNTNGSGVVTLTYVINHPYSHDAYWSDTSPLENGDILYVAEHTMEVATLNTVDLGNGPLTTNGFGVVSYTYNNNTEQEYFSMGATHSIWYWGTLAAGTFMYTGRHVNTLAINITPHLLSGGSFGGDYFKTNGSGEFAIANAYRPLTVNYADWTGAWQNCNGSGVSHTNLHTNATTLRVGVGVYNVDGYGSYSQDPSTHQLIVDGLSYSYSGGVITSISIC